MRVRLRVSCHIRPPWAVSEKPYRISEGLVKHATSHAALAVLPTRSAVCLTNTFHNRAPSSSTEYRRWYRQVIRRRTGWSAHLIHVDESEGSDRTVDAIDNGQSHTSAHVHYVIGSGGTGKSHLAQAIGQSAILQGYRVLYREAHVLLDDLADAAAAGTRKQFMTSQPLCHC
jgi:hypothetical protein